MRKLLFIPLLLFSLTLSAQRFNQAFVQTNGQSIVIPMSDLAFVYPGTTAGTSTLTLGPSLRVLYVNGTVSTIVDSSCGAIVPFTERRIANGVLTLRSVGVSMEHVSSVTPAPGGYATITLRNPNLTIVVNSSYSTAAGLLTACFSGGGGAGSGVVVVDSVAQLADYPTAAAEKFVQVKDTLRGGTFTWSSTGTVNNGTTFAGATGYWVRDREYGVNNPTWFGARGDGSNDTQGADAAYAAAVAEQGILDFPAGTFYVSTLADTLDGTRLTIRGRGSAVTTIKRLDNIVSPSNTSTRILRVSGLNGATLTIQGLTIDGNAVNQPVPSPNTQYQQCHNIFVQCLGDHAFSYINVQDVQSLDPLGDGLLLGGTSATGFGQANIVNYREGFRRYTRSSITVTCGGFDFVNVTNFEGPVVEVEPNGYSGIYQYGFNGVNWQCNQEIDLNWLNITAAGKSAYCNLSNIFLKGRINAMGEANFNISNFKFYTTDPLRMTWGTYKFTNGLVYADSAFSTTYLVYQSSANPSKQFTFDNVDFDAYSSVTLDWFYQDDNGFGALSTLSKFTGCRFLRPEFPSAGIRSGEFEFTDCIHTYTGATAAIVYSGNTTKTNVSNKLRLNGNVCPGAYLVQPPIAGDTVLYYPYNNVVGLGKMFNWTRYDKIAIFNNKGTATSTNAVNMVVTPCVYYAENLGSTDFNTTTWHPKVGKWIIDDQVIYPNPDSTNYMKAVCIRNGNGDGSSATGATSGANWAKEGMIVGVTPIAGDLTGFMSAPQLASMGANNGDILQWNGSDWTPIPVPSGTGDINNGGNTLGANITIGTNDPYTLSFETNGISRVTIDTSGNYQMRSSTAVPSAPADGLYFFVLDRAGKNLPAWIGEDGIQWEVGADPLGAKYAEWSANGNGSGVFVKTLNNGETNGATRNVATTNLFTSIRRRGYDTAGSAASTAGTTHNNTQWWRGNAAGLGGFTFRARFGFATANTTNKQAFIGMRASSSVISGNTDPSTLGNTIGFAIDATQTTLRFIHNDGSGSATSVNLGASFPSNTNSTDMYDVIIKAEANAGTVYYYIVNLSTGAAAWGNTSSDLPSSTTFLCPQFWISNGADATVVGLDVSQYGILTKY